MSRGGKQPGAGRPAGTPNRATTNAREAIASFVEGNVDRLNGWLDAIAQGEKKKQKILGGEEEKEIELEEWLREPDPDGAFKAFMSVIEYNIPKLARQELTTPPDQPFEVSHSLAEKDKEIINRFLASNKKL